ncbi:DUF2785 domain-containing protein [Nocardioides sp.]|uniref:DUF2785 domain-containing protein n=1 Tax=Nocardioides sp. TaxID=35761 RepID=UPI00271A721B|nr:DUF2785 domain-containing protein [Nocardioides sp.]MDO9456917.1 DUF2785 domain-containing protein [Nocardioides sp.]
MSRVNWKQVHDEDFRVPEGLPLADLTEELTVMLGDVDPERRDGTAYPTLATWISRGVYDDLLPGLGDGMVTGLGVGLGERDTDSVFRRAFSVLVLAECIARDNSRPLVLGGKVLQWGDAIATWVLREQDLRGWVDGKGWAHAVAHGADALAALAASPHLGHAELTVVLDVVADRLLLPVDQPLVHGEADRLVGTTMAVLRRGSVPLTVVEPWLNRVAAGASAHARASGRDPFLPTNTAQAFLRSLYLQLALGSRPPLVRADVMLVLVGLLRETNPAFRHP